MERVTPILLACIVVAGLFSLSCESRTVVVAFRWNDTAPTMPWIHVPGGYYRYAPSIVQVSPTSRFMYYCANTTSGQVKDHIMYRSATFANGLWSWTSEEEVALAPADPMYSDSGCDVSRKSFDCYHVCDPEYVQGGTVPVFQNKTYTLAMFYTGNDYNGSNHNSVGVAFNNDANGKWTRLADAVIPYGDSDSKSGSGTCANGTRHAGEYGWGAGQPSVTNIDNGHVLLLWSYGDCDDGTTTYRQEIDLSGSGPRRIGTAIPVSTQGLTDLNGAPDGVLNNVSFIFDGTRHMFFAVRHGHPDPVDPPNFLSQTLQIAALDEASVWNGGGTWQVLGNLSTTSAGYHGQATDWARNDNPGLLRTPYGTLYAYNRLEVFYSASRNSAQCGASIRCDLWTYTIASKVANIW